MKRKRRRLSKKELERRGRKIAEQESSARSASARRQERIKILWQELQSGHLAKETDKELVENELVRSLVELVDLQKREIHYLTQFRRNWEEIHAHFPAEAENLRTASFRVAWQPLFEKLLAEQKPREVWEYNRRGYTLPSGGGLIEYEFGGAGEGDWRKQPLASLFGLTYQPTCLDDIFAGGAVKMHDSEGEMFLLPHPHRILKPGLQRLFGLHRNRFPKNLPRPHKFRALVTIMDALLSEESRDRAKGVRGRPGRLWLSDSALRARVLTEIEARLKNLSAPEHIQAAFLAVVRRYLPKFG